MTGAVQDLPTDHLVFFGKGLELLGEEAGGMGDGVPEVDGRGAGSGDALPLPSRQIARVLLYGDGTPPTVAGLLSGSLSAERRYRRAVWLLHEHVRAERAARGRSREQFELWTSEWTWVSRSRWVRRWLEEQGRRLGVSECAASARQVQEAVTDELLPLMRIRSLLSSAADGLPATGFERQLVSDLSSWAIPSSRLLAFAEPFAAFLLALPRISDELEPGHRAQLELLFDALPPGEPCRATLVDAWLSWAKSTTSSALEREPTADWVERRLALLEYLDGLSGPTLAALQFQSALRQAAASLSSGSAIGLPTAARHAMIALTLNPYNDEARKGIASLLDAAEEFRQKVRDKEPGQMLNESGRALKTSFSRVQKLVQGFPESDLGKRTSARLREAVVRELVRQLGLDGASKSDHRLVETLANVLEEESSKFGGEDRAQLARTIRQVCIERDDGFARIPWPLVEAAVVEHPVERALELALVLPARPERRLSELTERLRVAGSAPSGSPGGHRPRLLPRSTPALIWLCSSRDLMFKAVAALGVAMAVYGAFAASQRETREAELARSYAAVLDGIGRGDESGALESAQQFLARSDPADPRADQVVRLATAIAFDSAMGFVEQNDVDSVTEVLERWERATREHATPGEESAE